MKYLVEGNIRHDGDRYGAGDVIDLDERTAKSLIAAGVLQGPPSDEERGAGEGEGLDRDDAIRKAINGLEDGNQAHWTRSGKPDVNALRSATGIEDISAAERDEAWERHADSEGA